VARPTAFGVGCSAVLWSRWGTPDSGAVDPPMGGLVHRTGDNERGGRPPRRLGGGSMKVVKRLAVALGSLLALAVAGGAHWRF